MPIAAMRLRRPAVASYSGFDAAKKGTLANIDNGGFDLYTGTGGGTNRWAMSVAGKTAGKYRAQILDVTHSNTVAIGVAFNTAIGTFAGATANAAALFGNYSGSLRMYTNNAFSPYTGSVATGDRIDVYVDATAGRVWWGKNGVPISGDPAAGTGAMYTYTPGTTTFLIGDTTGAAGRIRLLRGDQISDPLPTGFINGWPD